MDMHDRGGEKGPRPQGRGRTARRRGAAVRAGGEKALAYGSSFVRLAELFRPLPCGRCTTPKGRQPVKAEPRGWSYRKPRFAGYIDAHGVAAEAIDRAYIGSLFGNGSCPKQTLGCQPFEWNDRLWVAAGGTTNGDGGGRKEWEVLPLYLFADFQVQFPKIKTRLFPDLPLDATDEQRAEFYTGVKLRAAGRNGTYVVGPSRDARLIASRAREAVHA